MTKAVTTPFSRWANWSLDRRSPWHKVNTEEGKETICGKTFKRSPVWAHSHTPDDGDKTKFCSKCLALPTIFAGERGASVGDLQFSSKGSA